MAAPPPLRDRLSFLHRLPILLKGTSDDDVPCPGYLFEEIAKISHESVGSSQCLLEYLLNRLDSSSGHVKLKVLKILLYLCSHGSSSFLLILRRNSALIQEATVFAGPPDPLHGNSLYQKVRAAAQDLGSTLYSDAAPLPPSQPARALPPTGMGSQSRPLSALQGFGYSQEQGRAGSTGEAFLSTIQRAAEAVVNAVHPGPENPWTQRPLPQGDTYQPAVTPSSSHHAPGNLLPGATPYARAVRHQPGQAGGGWDELDSSPGSHSSSRNSDQSRASDSGSRSGSDSHSGASQEPGDLAERVEAMSPSDCQQELSLVRTVTQGPRAFLSREEAQRFIKECGLLNCEAVLELLLSHLGTASEREQTVRRGSREHRGRLGEPGRERVRKVWRDRPSTSRTRSTGVEEQGPQSGPWQASLPSGTEGARADLLFLPRLQRALCAIASLGSADLLPQEHILLLSRRQLQALSMGSPGPVTSKATKILRHFEASCGQRPPAPRPCAEPSPTATLVGPSDLLTDPEPPPGGQVVLQPLSSSPVLPGSLAPSPAADTSAFPTPRHASKAETLPEEQGARPVQGLGDMETPEGGPGPCPWNHNSLFAGMELVACPRLVGVQATAEGPKPAPHCPRTWAQRAAATEPPDPELSAFAFLNK